MAENHWNLDIRKTALKMAVFLSAITYSLVGEYVEYETTQGKQKIELTELPKQLELRQFKNNLGQNELNTTALKPQA